MNKDIKKKVFAIVLARMSASRLPGKVMKEILGVPILKILIDRIKDSELLDGIVVATSINKEDNIIEEFCNKNKINVFRGSEKDVLERIYFAARKYNADVIVEQGADCPLVDSELIDSALKFYLNNDFDYVTTLHNNRKGPHGYFLRVCPINLLEDIYKTTTNISYNREDTLFYIESHPEIYRIGNFIPNKETHAKDFRITIDTQKDFEFIKVILEHFNSIKVQMKDIVKYLKEKPDLNLINKTGHHAEYKLYRIGIIGSQKIDDDFHLLLDDLSKYKKVNEYLSVGFRLVAISDNKNVKDFQENFGVKRFYENPKEMLERESLDILITSAIDLDLAKEIVRNGLGFIFFVNNNFPEEIKMICKENNIDLKTIKSNNFKETINAVREAIRVH